MQGHRWGGAVISLVTPPEPSPALPTVFLIVATPAGGDHPVIDGGRDTTGLRRSHPYP